MIACKNCRYWCEVSDITYEEQDKRGECGNADEHESRILMIPRVRKKGSVAFNVLEPCELDKLGVTLHASMMTYGDHFCSEFVQKHD